MGFVLFVNVGYIAAHIWQRQFRKRYRKPAAMLLFCVLGFIYTSSHRQDNTYYGFCYTSSEALSGERREYPDSISTAGLLRKLSASCWQLVSSGCRRQPAYLPHVWGTYNYDVLYRASDHARTTLGPRMPHL